MKGKIKLRFEGDETLEEIREALHWALPSVATAKADMPPASYLREQAILAELPDGEHLPENIFNTGGEYHPPSLLGDDEPVVTGDGTESGGKPDPEPKPVDIAHAYDGGLSWNMGDGWHFQWETPGEALEGAEQPNSLLIPTIDLGERTSYRTDWGEEEEPITPAEAVSLKLHRRGLTWQQVAAAMGTDKETVRQSQDSGRKRESYRRECLPRLKQDGHYPHAPVACLESWACNYHLHFVPPETDGEDARGAQAKFWKLPKHTYTAEPNPTGDETPNHGARKGIQLRGPHRLFTADKQTAPEVFPWVARLVDSWRAEVPKVRAGGDPLDGIRHGVWMNRDGNPQTYSRWEPPSRRIIGAPPETDCYWWDDRKCWPYRWEPLKRYLLAEVFGSNAGLVAQECWPWAYQGTAYSEVADKQAVSAVLELAASYDQDVKGKNRNRLTTSVQNALMEASRNEGGEEWHRPWAAKGEKRPSRA
jgi:hypothetical protein